MNAPFGWPTRYPLPKFRIKRVAITGIGFLLASCSDTLTQPGERPSAKEPVPAPVTPDVVIMERTITDASDGTSAPLIHSSREVLTATVRLAGHGADVRAFTPPTGGANIPRTLPRPPLSLPARRELAMCNALPAWMERSRGANGQETIISGVGDAPASSIRIVQSDGSAWTIERHWTRATTSWQLDRQVTTGTRGFRDVVSYHHQDAKGQPVDNAIPTTSCTGQQRLEGQASLAASRTFYAPYSPTLYAKLVPGAGVFEDDACVNDPSDPCFDKRITVMKDELTVAAAAIGVGVACISPAVITVGPCALAMTAYYLALGNLVLDQLSYQNCLNENRYRTPQLFIGANSPSSVAPPGGTRSLAMRAPTVAAVGSCGGSDPTAGTHCRWDVWEISYDGGETWSIFGSFLICDNAI